MHIAHSMLDLIYNNKNISDHSSGFVLNHIETFLSQPAEIRNHHLMCELRVLTYFFSKTIQIYTAQTALGCELSVKVYLSAEM